MLEKINGSAQFAAKTGNERLQMRFHFLRHADFDSFSLGISDVHGLSQPSRKPVAAQFNGTAQAQFAFRKDADAGSFEPEIDKRDGVLLYTSPSPRDRQKSRMPSSA